MTTQLDSALNEIKIDPRLSDLIFSIEPMLRATLKLDFSVQPLTLVELSSIVAAWKGVFYSSSGQQFHLLNLNGEHTIHSVSDSYWAIKSTFGTFVKESEIKREYKGKKTFEDVLSGLEDSILKLFVKHVKLYRQRNHIEYEVDIFSDISSMVLKPESVKISYVHRPFQIKDSPSEDVIYDVLFDFGEHFPQFDEFVELIAAARFASDRRDAFLWFKAASNWGKGFLLAVLDELGITVELSVKEIEKSLEGAPVGKSSKDFVRAWVLVVDEFKSVKAEIKQLNNSIVASPKHQLSFKAPLYTKLFLSAENVDSLAGSEGVESQFANRFSLISPTTKTIDERPLFKDIGKQTYLKAVACAIADELNQSVKEMRRLGPVEATKICDDILNSFNQENRLDKHFGSLDDSVEDYVRELQGLLRQVGDYIDKNNARGGPFYLSSLPLHPDLIRHLNENIVFGEYSDHATAVVLKSPMKFIKQWLLCKVDRSQQTMVAMKARQVCDMANESGEWNAAKRIKTNDGEQVCKGLLVVCNPVTPVSFM